MHALQMLAYLGAPSFFVHLNMRLTPFFLPLVRLEAHCGGSEVYKWYLVLPEQAQELVRAVGFETFIRGLNLPKVDWSLMTSLVERW